MPLTSLTIAGRPLYFAPERCRPPGAIADQSTDAEGVWVAAAENGPWLKTGLTHDRAVRGALKAGSVAEAMTTLGVGQPEPAPPSKPEPKPPMPMAEAPPERTRR